MQITRHRPPTGDGDDISFPLLECWNPMANVAILAAEVNNRRVSCRVSLAILQSRFQASADEPMLSVAKNRTTLQAAARKLIEKLAFEEDGSIVIRSKDL